MKLVVFCFLGVGGGGGGGGGGDMVPSNLIN